MSTRLLETHQSIDTAPPGFAAYAALATSKYVLLTTYRRNGEPVRTPVWIAPGGADRTLYIFTVARAGKVKRIRNNPRVELAPCSFRGKVRGPTVRARASILPPGHHQAAGRALTRKYPIAKRLLFTVNRLTSRKRSSEYGTYLRIDLAA